MNFDALKFLDDYGIDYITTGKNVQKGWINIQCPFCDDHSKHGGFHFQNGGYYSCWVCGWHDLESIIKRLVKNDDPKIIKNKYITRNRILRKLNEEVEKVPFEIPGKELSENHYSYINKRGFNAKYIENKYHLLGTNHLGNYKFRIIAPIYYGNRIVSFQGRDITGLQELRYKGCSMDMEIIHYKHILYNLDNCKEKWCVVVEGITDVWRLGDNSCSVFGIEFTHNQVLELVKKFDKVFILFDNEERAQEKAMDLCNRIESLGKFSEVLNVAGKKDPAEYTDEEAKFLMDFLKDKSNG